MITLTTLAEQLRTGATPLGDGGTDDAEDMTSSRVRHVIQDWIAGDVHGPSHTTIPGSAGLADWSFPDICSHGIGARVTPLSRLGCLLWWRRPISALCLSGRRGLRRVIARKTGPINSDNAGTEHLNGEIWSSALREIFMSMAQGLGPDAGKRWQTRRSSRVRSGAAESNVRDDGDETDSGRRRLNGSATCKRSTAMMTRGFCRRPTAVSPHGG